MTAKFVVLVLATASLAACTTASTDDVAVRRGASPTRGEINHRHVVVRGPVVPDSAAATHTAAVTHHAATTRTAAVTHRRATHTAAATHRAATTHVAAAQPATASAPSDAAETAPVKPRVVKPVTSKYAAREVPNPLRQAPAAAPSVPAADVSNLPTEPVQPASATDQPAPQAPLEVIPPTAPGDVPIQETTTQPAPSSSSSGPLGLSSITPDTIEQMFGGMPFWLIAVIAAALVATFGLAIRPKPEKDDEEYEEPHADHHDDEADYHHDREPYAA